VRILIRAEQRAGWKCQKKGILRKREVEEGNAQFLLSEREKKQQEIKQYTTLTVIWFVPGMDFPSFTVCCRNYNLKPKMKKPIQEKRKVLLFLVR